MPKKSKSKSLQSEATYNIEKLIGHLPKSADGPSNAESYLVKWEGYVVGEATWETSQSLTETSKLTIDEYWMGIKNGGAATPAESEHKKDDDVKIKPDEIANHVAEKLDNAEKEQLSSEIVENAVVDDNNEPEEYIIEEILDTFPKSATKKEEVKKYVIKWEGYDKPEDITKEPADEIQNSAPGKVKEFWQKKNQQKKLAEKKKKEPAKKEEDDAEMEPAAEPIQSPGKRRSSRALKKIPEPAVKKIKISPKKKKNDSEEKSSPETETPSNDSTVKDSVKDLIKRVDKLEAKPNEDREFLKKLLKRNDLPKNIKNLINIQLKSDN